MSAWPRCWCQGEAAKTVGEDYRVCSACGTLVSRFAGDHARYATVGDGEKGHYGVSYWHRRVPEELGQPSLAIRAESDLKERCPHWLGRIATTHPPPASVLELGSAHGGFVHLLAEAGYDAEGLEMSPAVVEEARQRFGITMHRGPLTSAEIGRRFDIVAAMDVLEHLVDPVGTLEACRRHLAEAGSLFLQTPCFREEDAGWPMLIAEDHLFLFNEKSVRRLLENAGFVDVRTGKALFAYDMWISARMPGPKRERAGTLRPVAHALVSLRQEAEAWIAERDAIEQDRQRKDMVIARLEGERDGIDRDRRNKDDVIARLEGERDGIDRDRRNKDDVIARLEKERDAIDRDRRNKDDIIARLEKERDAIDNDRRSKDDVIARLEKERDAIDNDRQRKDDVIARLVAEGERVELDRKSKDELIERLIAEWDEMHEARWAGQERLSCMVAERDVLRRDRDEGPAPALRIGVHLASLRPGEIGGAERHVRQLLDRIAVIDPSITWVLALAPYNADTFEDRPEIEKHVLDPEAFASLDAAMLATWNLDLWFCPLLTLEPPEPELPSVVVIPDLQHETLPEHFTPDLLAWRREHYGRTVRDATSVLTVSDFSRRDLIDRFRLEGPHAERVVAVPHGVDPWFTEGSWHSRTDYLPSLRARYGLDRPYLFFPAHGWPHKNHRALFEALALLSADQAPCPDLVLTGGGADPDWPDRWQKLGIEARVRHLGRVPNEDLPGLYAGAELMVFPSRFEGFGLPLLESMACRCPILTSDTTSLGEVGGDAVAYVDTTSPREIADAIRELLADPGRRLDLARRGRERVAGFTADRAARSTLSMLRAVARQRDRSFTATAHQAPRLSIITPSYEQGAFLARTLDSVLEQGYPNLEYWVLDGGSTDGTIELLEAYKKRYPGVLEFVSEPDHGQADAVNKGLDRATGSIIGWLNSDDVYRPETFDAVVEAFDREPAHAWLYGHAGYIDADDRALGRYPTRAPFTWRDLAHECFLCQPSVFWRPEPLAHPRLDRNLHMCLDYDLWIRLSKHHPPLFLDRDLAASRVHGDAKTLTLRKRGFDETIGTVKRHYGYGPVSWATGRAHHILQSDDDPLFPGRIKLRTWLLAGLLVARYNPTRPRYVWQALGELMKEAKRKRHQGRA